MGTTVTRKNGFSFSVYYWEFCDIRGVFTVDSSGFFHAYSERPADWQALHFIIYVNSSCWLLEQFLPSTVAIYFVTMGYAVIMLLFRKCHANQKGIIIFRTLSVWPNITSVKTKVSIVKESYSWQTFDILSEGPISVALSLSVSFRHLVPTFSSLRLCHLFNLSFSVIYFSYLSGRYWIFLVIFVLVAHHLVFLFLPLSLLFLLLW